MLHRQSSCVTDLQRKKILVFAHVPPPLHGQSVMVEALIHALTENEHCEVFHVNARYSDSNVDVGGLSFWKLVALFKYLFYAISLRSTKRVRRIYYVPAPAKLSAVVRDVFALPILRLFFPYLILHWHAIGLGQWVEGKIRLSGPKLPEWMENLLRRWVYWCFQRADLALVIAPGNKDDAAIFKPRKIAILPNGIADPVLFDEKLSEGRVVSGSRSILFLSRLTEKKGVWDALLGVRCAAQRAPELQWSLTLAGGFLRDQEEAAIRRQIEINRLSNFKVELLGFIQGAEKASRIKSSDMVLFPSHDESFGLVAVEALAWGVPVIGSDIPSIRSVLEGTGCALVPVGSPESIAGALLDDRNYIGSEILRKKYNDCFTLDRFKESVIRIFA